MASKILIVDDDLSICRSLKEVLEENGFQANYSQTPLNIAESITCESVDLVLLDIRMPQMGGIDLLEIIRKKNKDIPVIIISGYATVDIAVAAMKHGAINFFTKPIDLPKLLAEMHTICMSTRDGSFTSHIGEKVITRNSRMQEFMNLAEKAAPTDATVLIVGESGTGKELVADTIHRKSRRSRGAFVKVNCAAIPEYLLESEFFGYEKGAFTDAKTRKQGKFEMAAGGSIFLDEIGDMSYNLQAKLLRFLQEKRFTRIGGSEQIEADCRIIAATNKNLEEQIKIGAFREDLYYRLSVITFQIPPLRERKDDILPLAEYFLSHFCQLYGKHLPDFSDKIVAFMLNHSWPGNVRELKNFVERTVIFTDDNSMDYGNMPEQYKPVGENGEIVSLRDKESEVSKEIIREALHRSKGNKTRAADLLKIDRKTLYNRLRKLNIDP